MCAVFVSKEKERVKENNVAREKKKRRIRGETRKKQNRERN
jgi:hypothetical protein